MSYLVKEIFYTLQGEGAQAGRPAVFCRFAGCNLWSGREADRSAALCRFCDTDFRGTDGEGGGRYADARTLADKILATWPCEASAAVRPYVVCTGGEPLLQLDAALVDALRARGCEVAVETNGTCEPPAGIDWLCVSPKAGGDLVIRSGDELKLVYPQPALPPESLEGLAFRHFFLQPMDGAELVASTEAALAYCKAHPRWRLSLQLHKLLGIP
ncbi:7-carboxy-7-deazaguanine synthase [Thiorhodococcus minor]|uniref:7-carboxy-7-deazaguanine synthase n=1 Tax=Thiorhodococcus minor TaxID=57489 RepID=A0A6M0JWP7_9GAMM|nr:7-carboxy-7-deazaguanine synthase [Thiorhodococcus minor]NEV61930.1 7-carboxy-7-deazaguanine synthase [Thiorhodococcus minor]